jgi:hypothetical protein
MNTKDLLKEAIADAKAVRETALAQAKLALEEAFTPRLQSMFAAKLQEKMDDMEKDDMIGELEDKEVYEANYDMAKKDKMEGMDMNDDGDTIEEIDLDEILAELESELNEAKEADEEEIEAEEDVEDEEAGEEEEEEEEKEVSELSMDELEELIRDIVSQEMGPDGGEEANMDMDMDASADMDMDMDMADELPDTADDEVNLDEILAELLDEKEELYEGKKRSKYGGKKGDVPASKRGDKKSTAEEEGVEDYKKKKKVEEDLQLALEAVNTLRQELQEVNLLNAKLLYVNKIFKAKNLTESQKIKVIQTFDKAESAKEAKLVYESLSETFTTKAGRNQIKESLGFASKAAGVAPQKQQIVEGNEFIARMKKLANIK